MARRSLALLIVLPLSALLVWSFWPDPNPDPALEQASRSSGKAERTRRELAPTLGGMPMAGARVSGRVVRAGQAVADARVVLRSDADGFVREVTSGPEGEFSLDGLPAGAFLLSASLELQASPVQGPIALSAGESRSDVVLELLPGASVAGQVVDARTREVIAGAVVRSSSGTVTTDHAGRFRLSPVPAGPTWLEASAAGYAARIEWLTVQAAREHGGMELFLKPATRLSGVVTRLDRPVPGATVWAERADLGAWTERFGPVSTGPDGRFTIDVGTGELKLVASAEGGARVEGPMLTVAEGRGRDDLRIELGEGLEIAGTVTVDGEPAAGARVILIDGRSQQPAAATMTGNSGVFRFEGVAPGPYLAQVESGPVVAQRGPFQVTGPDDVPWSIELESGRGLAGRVEPPQAGVVVRLRTSEWAGGEGAQRTTDGEGRFAFDGVPEGVLELEADSGEAFARAAVRAGDDVVLRLARSELVGYAADERGRAVTDFVVRVLPTSGGASRLFPVLDPEGNFRLMLPPGTYEVTASASGYGETLESSRVEVPAGGSSGTLRLTLAAPLHVEGRVVDSESKSPLDGVEVTVFRGQMSRVVNFERAATVMTGPDGRFQFGALPRQATLRMRKAGYRTRWAPLQRVGQGGALGDVPMSMLKPGDRGNDGPGIAEPYEGVGMQLRVLADGVAVAGVFEGGPAQRAGVLAGDRILGIDGESVAGWPANQVTERIMGPSGTVVRLTLRREERSFDVVLRRRSIQL